MACFHSDRALGKPLGAGGPDVVGGERLEHGRSGYGA